VVEQDGHRYGWLSKVLTQLSVSALCWPRSAQRDDCRRIVQWGITRQRLDILYCVVIDQQRSTVALAAVNDAVTHCINAIQDRTPAF
jgi:hypothetical protein